MELARLIRDCAKLEGEFLLRSGVISNTYFDKYLFESDPKILFKIATEMAALIPPNTEILAGLEMGGIPIVTALSQITGIPAAFIRKEAKGYGTCKYAEGPSLLNKKVTIVEDVVSSGGAILDALSKLASDGIKPNAIICVIDRQTGGAENIAKAGHTLASVLTMSDIDNAA